MIAMIIDDKGRIFGKVSVIDLFVVAALAAVIIVGVLKIGNTSYSNARGADQVVQMKFYTEAVENFTAGKITIGDSVVNESNDSSLGKVVEVVLGESVEYHPDADGINQPSPKEGYSSLTVTSELVGQMSDGSVAVDGNLYSTGSEIIIRAGSAKLFLRIAGIEVIQ